MTPLIPVATFEAILALVLAAAPANPGASAPSTASVPSTASGASGTPSPDASATDEGEATNGAPTIAPTIAPKKGPRPPEEAAPPPANTGTKQVRVVPIELRPAAPEVDLGLWADDSSRLPRIEPAPVVAAPPVSGGRSGTARSLPLVGWSGALAEPAFVDHHHRLTYVARPASFGHTLKPGERFKYDVYFGATRRARRRRPWWRASRGLSARRTASASRARRGPAGWRRC